MDPIASVLEKVKSFTKSSQDLVSRHFGFHENPSRLNPVSLSIPFTHFVLKINFLFEM
jgi:hypothetical protein